MRGETSRQASMLLGKTPEDFIPIDHPVRRIKAIVEDVLNELSPTFELMYKALWAALCAVGAPAQSDTADGPLHGPLGAPVL